jgi:hypothetical protein
MAKKSMAHGSKKWRGWAKRFTREGVERHNRTLEAYGLHLRLRIVKKGKPMRPGAVSVDANTAKDLDCLLDELRANDPGDH